MSAIEIPAGLNVKTEAVNKALNEGKFVQVNSNAKGPTVIQVGGITNMFASILNGKKMVNGFPISPEDGYMYLPNYGLAGPFDDVVEALRILGYDEAQVKDAVADPANITQDNFREEGTISADAANLRKAAQAARRTANPTATRSRASGTINWAALTAMARNKAMLQPMSKDNHMEKCSATRINRGKKSQYDGLISRISKRKAGAFLDLNHIEKPANANRSIKWKAITAESKVHGAYLDNDFFPIFSNNESNVRRFANQYKKVPVPEGMTKLSDAEVNELVEEWKEAFDAYTRSQSARKKKVVITSSSIDKSKVVGGGGSAIKAPTRIAVKKTSTMSKPAVAAAKVVPVEDLEPQTGYSVSPRGSRKAPSVLQAKKPLKRGSRSSASSVASGSASASAADIEMPEEDEDDFDADDFDI